MCLIQRYVVAQNYLYISQCRLVQYFVNLTALTTVRVSKRLENG